MKNATAIACVVLDIGEVPLTDGWEYLVRKRVATHFKLELAEMEDRHHMAFETYVRSDCRGLGASKHSHPDYNPTRAKLASFGLQTVEGALHENS